ncbi:putative membrane protein [Variovorax sp. CF313]|uniref:MgtC/SapB family protein n=1 Tax=Variovorax sp. CF313 TaxID=1144315 RepID=UPI00027101E3|nr:MgtC/SapB family protein [Variovorax sp. CF313]EJL80407.1 putative membrane protein [Variovorax sp. CF313]
MNTFSPSAAIVGLAVALGIGMMVGIERERRKGDGDRRAAAGLRTFAVVALAGAVAQILPVPALVPIGGALVATLAAVSHWKSRSQDPGMTTEIALFATYLVGVLCIIEPSLGAACGTGLALLLAARRRLHRFATELLSEQELHDGILLAALALIALPLISSRPIEMLGGINPRPLASMVLLIMAIQAAGQAAVRWLGVRGGLLGAGFASGFVSSTATVASFGNRAREQPLHTGLLAGAAALSAVATWVLALAMTTALSPPAGLALLPVALAGAAGAAVVGLLPLLSSRPSAAIEAPASTRTALRPREAFTVALALALVALLVGTAQRHFGDTGLQVGIALAALVDAHAPVASLASLHAAGTLSADQFVRGVLVAVGTNTLTRCMVALAAGGRAYALRVAAALVASLACACAVAVWLKG